MATLPRILSVDDDSGISLLLARLFEGRFHCWFESDPKNVRAVARAFQPDLLILDVCMPGRNGFTLARELREEPILRDRPIILFTSIISGRKSTAVWECKGPTEILPKGVSTDVLLDAIDRLLLTNCRSISGC